ncbi:SDR family NAD(P)-dependent oxidoreductase [Allosphingosinicella sp.]|uniref:SDR family NAD(P)-dependent oxidoreductase n=1 Tax=Allosphingosinicella sp. TaxID=2823234 RepID=UPI003D74226F
MIAIDLSGKAALVTGAARGIGRAIALRLAEAGADVAIADLDLSGAAEFGEQLSAASVEEEIRDLGRRATSFAGDLGISVNCDAFLAKSAVALGRIDILVNCAGGAIVPHDSGWGSAASDTDIEKIFAANYGSMAYCCRAAVPYMRQSKGGAIVNIASTAGYESQARGALAHYGAFKAAVINYARSLAAEVGHDGIRVNTVAPGIVMTARIAALAAARGIGTPDQAEATPLRRLGQADDIAKAVLFFASDLSGFVTGQCLAVNGGAPSLAC